MFGDSLGDFVDSDIHGIFGWNHFLSSVRPDISDWRVQNLAQAGNRTENPGAFKPTGFPKLPIYNEDWASLVGCIFV